MAHTCAPQTKSPFFPDSPRPSMAECDMLQAVVPISIFQKEAGILDMGNRDRRADTELVSACLSGSEQAWTDFYTLYHSLVEAVVNRHARSSSKDIREDLVQEVYKSLVEALAQYDGRSSSLRTFVSMVAQRTCIDCWRGRSRMSRKGHNVPVDHHGDADPEEVVLQSDLDPPDEQLVKAEYGVMIRSALNQLASACRELLTLRFFSELTYAEIAVKVGKKENTVTVAIRRCLAQLKAEYDDLENEGLRT